MSTTPETYEQQAAGVQERRSTLAAELEAVEAKIEAERNGLGTMVARGGDTSEHRERLRELSEEAEGLRRALPILDRERESLAAQATEVRLASARTEHGAATDRQQRAFAGMETTLQTFIAGPLAEARTELEEATRTHEETQDQLGKLVQATGGVAPKHLYPWEKHQALRLLLDTLEQFGRTGSATVHGYSAVRGRGTEEETERTLAFR
jgi:chromosome segregation ATPase